MGDALARVLKLPAPTLLIGSVVIVSLWAWLFKPALRGMILNPYRVRHRGELYRLLTAGWVHADLSHLVLNMIMLFYFTERAIPVLGTTRFLVLYISAVVVAFIPTTLRYGNNPAYNSLGASGAVSAVMVSAFLLYPRLTFRVFFLPTPIHGAVIAAAYVGYSLWHSLTAGDGVNHDAHFSGAVYGAFLTYLFEPSRVERALRTLW
jgi:membrane associated rhomboid family serine protease